MCWGSERSKSGSEIVRVGEMKIAEMGEESEAGGGDWGNGFPQVSGLEWGEEEYKSGYHEMVRVCVQFRVLSGGRVDWSSAEMAESKRCKGGVRWDRDICRTIQLTGAFSIWRNDVRMRGKTGELIHHVDASGVWDDLLLTLSVRSKLPLSDVPRLILCLTFSHSSHQKKLDLNALYPSGPTEIATCVLNQLWDAAAAAAAGFFSSLISAERHSCQTLTGSSSISGTTLFHFITKSFKLDRKTWWVHLKVALSVCLCASDVCTFLHKRERYDLRERK